MLRESISPEAVAKEYGLDTIEVTRWKANFLEHLKTATKGAAKKGATKKPTSKPRKGGGSMVKDISHKRIRKEDAKRPAGKASPLVPFPDQPDTKPLSPAERKNLEKTQRLIIEKGQVADAGKKLGMMPRHHYEAPKVGPISQAGAPPVELPDGPGAHELPDDAKERFAKNWAKVGADAPPLAQIPAPPMRISLRERLAARFQSLPVISWALRGGRLDSPWLLLLLLLLIGGAVFMSLRDWSTYVGDRSTSVEALEETPRYLRPISRDQIEASEKLIRDFYTVRTIEGLEPYIRMPGTVLPVMRRYYLTRTVKPQEVGGFDYHRRADNEELDLTIHGAILGHLGKVREITIEHTSEGPRIDWETAVRYQPMEWHEFRRARPAGTTYFRLNLQPSTFYQKPFQDKTIYRSFRLVYPGELRPLNGFAMLDTEVELALRKLFPDDISTHNVIVGLNFQGSSEPGDGLVEISEFMSDSWVMNYQENERHIDRREPERAVLPEIENPAPPDPDPSAPEAEPDPNAPETEPTTPPTEPEVVPAKVVPAKVVEPKD